MEAIMLRGATVAVAALLVAGPVLADETCLSVARGAQCDVFLDEFRASDIPVGTTDIWASDEFLLERHQDFGPESGVESPDGKDVLFWDGDSAMIVPEETGPRLEIADW